MASFGKKPSAAQGKFGKKSVPSARQANAGRFTSASASSEALSPEAQAFLNDYKAEAGNEFANSSGKSGGASFAMSGSGGHIGEKPVGFTRVWSYLIDSVLITLPIFILMWPYIVTQLEVMSTAPEGSVAAAKANLNLYKFVLVNAVVRCIYAVAMESSALQATIGKMLLGQIVTNKQMTKPSLGQVIMRNTLGRFVLNIIPFNIGYFMAFFGEKKGVHDMMSGTRVCRKAVAGYGGSMGEVFA